MAPQSSVAVFTVVHTVVLRPLPYPEPNRLVQISPGLNFNIALVDAVANGAQDHQIAGTTPWTR